MFLEKVRPYNLVPCRFQFLGGSVSLTHAVTGYSIVIRPSSTREAPTIMSEPITSRAASGADDCTTSLMRVVLKCCRRYLYMPSTIVP